MAVRIRMTKHGRKHRPFFRIVAIDARQPRDGRVLEELGTYDPMVHNTDDRVRLRASRIKYWKSVGAIPSEKVAVLLEKYLKKWEKIEQEEQDGQQPVLPPAPPTLQATPGDSQVSLNWTAPAGATSYDVYRGATPQAALAGPIQTGVTTTSFTDTGLTNGTSYSYVVTAVNSSGPSPPSNLVTVTPQLVLPPAYHAYEAQIDVLLQERGFAAGVRHRDWTGWPAGSATWQRFSGEVWCLALDPGGVISFGVHENFIREATAWALGPGSSLSRFLAWARTNPHFPAALRPMTLMFNRNHRQYWGFHFGPTSGIETARALIVEVVNAFVIYMTGGQPWGPPSTVTGVAEPGVPCLQTAPMPDPNQTPYHSLPLMAQYIFPRLQQHGYRQTNHKGSVSWEGPIGPGRDEVAFKLCYFGPHDWLFGVNRDLVYANIGLRSLAGDFDCRFHIRPVTQTSRPVYLGFPVYDTQASYDRILGVVLQLSHPSWVASASVTVPGGSPAYALDGDAATRWSTGVPQAAGQWFQLDLGSAQTLRRIVLDASGSPIEYPRGYAVYVSDTGTDWATLSPIVTGVGTSAITTITLAAAIETRYVRIVQTGSSPTDSWSIHRFNLFM